MKMLSPVLVVVQRVVLSSLFVAQPVWAAQPVLPVDRRAHGHQNGQQQNGPQHPPAQPQGNGKRFLSPPGSSSGSESGSRGHGGVSGHGTTSMPRSSTVGATSKKAAAEQRRQQDYTSAANGKDYANSSGTSAGSSRTGSGSGSSSGGGRTGAGAPINKGILKHHQGGFVGVDDEFPPLPGRGAGRHLALAEDTKLPPAFAACAICGEEKPLGARCLTEKCGLTYCSACFAIPFLPSLVGDQCLLDATPTQDARGSRGSSRFGRGRSSSDQGGEPDELDDSQLDDSQNERRAAGLESSQNDDDEEEKETNVHLMDADGILFSKPQRATCFTCRQPLSVPRKGVGSTAPPSGDIKTKTCWNKIRQPQRPQVSDEGEQHLAPHHICDDEETTLLELLNRGVELLSVPQRHALKALKSTLQRSLVAYAMLLFWYTFRLQPLHDWEVKQQSEHRKNHHGTSQEQKKHKGERMWDNDAEDMHMTSGTGNDPASDEASCRYTPEAMAVSVSGRHANYYLGLEDTESDLFNKLTNIRFLRLLTDAFEPDGTSLQFGDAAELHWHGPQWKRQYREVFQKHMRRSMWRVALFSLREKFKKVYSVDPVTATFENDEQMTEDQFLIALEKDWSSKVQEATGKYEEARTTPLARAEQEEQELLAALLFADEASDFGEGGMMNQAMVAQQMRELRHYQQMAEEEKYKREREASMQSSHGGSMDHDSTMNESDSTNPTTSSGAEASSGKRSCTSKKAKGPGAKKGKDNEQEEKTDRRSFDEKQKSPKRHKLRLKCCRRKRKAVDVVEEEKDVDSDVGRREKKKKARKSKKPSSNRNSKKDASSS